MLAYTSWVHKYNGNIDYLSPTYLNSVLLYGQKIWQFEVLHTNYQNIINYYATNIISRYYNNYDLITAITYRSGVSSFSSWQVDVSPTNGVQMSL